jgi:hypothetical protein
MLVEDKIRRFKGECTHFRFNKCPIYTLDGASAKFSTNSHETDYSVPEGQDLGIDPELIKRLKIRTLYAHCRVSICTKVRVKGSVSLD